jgi:hypothetical protein
MAEDRKPWAPTVASLVANLRSELSNADTGHAELAVQGVPTPCHVGLDQAGWTWVRVTCDPSSVVTDDQSAAVNFHVTPQGYRVSVSPTTADMVSTHFLEEIIQLVRSDHAPGDAGRAALQAWRELLARPVGEPLSEKALVGLYGELEILETILGLGGALDSWTGWSKDHNDFRLPGLVIEVKTTTSANYRRVRIHGLGQLDDPNDGSSLILVLRRLEQSPNGRSVPVLIDDIVRLGAPRSVLLERLANVHYSEQHRSQYESLRFVSSEVALRKIDDEHPRLVPARLAQVDLGSIDKVDYELNLNGDPEADLEGTLEDIVATHLGAS